MSRKRKAGTTVQGPGLFFCSELAIRIDLGMARIGRLFHHCIARVFLLLICVFFCCEEDIACEIKRPKGIGIGGPDGPISLDDFKSLQRSNTVCSSSIEASVIRCWCLYKP